MSHAQSSPIFCRPAGKGRDPIYVRWTVENENHLTALSRHVQQHHDPQRGDCVCTRKDADRNDSTYLWDGERLVCWISEPDDYGTTAPSMVARPGEPIDLFSCQNCHSNYWWPTAEQRAAVKAAQSQVITDKVAFRDVVTSDAKGEVTYRFMIDAEAEADIEKGIYNYHPDEWESLDGSVCAQVLLGTVGPSGDENKQKIYPWGYGELVLVSVGPVVEEELIYWDAYCDM